MTFKWNIKIGKTETNFSDWEAVEVFLKQYSVDTKLVHKTCFIKGKKFIFNHNEISCTIKYS